MVAAADMEPDVHNTWRVVGVTSGGAPQPKLRQLQRKQLMQVSPMDSIFTAWNWGNAWILSGKVYQNPQPSIFFTKIGDYVNQKSSIVIRKTTNSFSNISGLVKLN